MSDFKDKIKLIHEGLGISEDYEISCNLILQREEPHVTEIENDIYDRPQFLIPSAATAWKKMKDQASKENVILQVVSAFRSVDKQTEIVQRKIDRGQLIDDILRVSAAPGYSEHHTGRVLDITTEGCAPLIEAFEKTPAFKWLQQNAHLYSFILSYPKNNKYGITYEPWHWAYNK